MKFDLINIINDIKKNIQRQIKPILTFGVGITTFFTPFNSMVKELNFNFTQFNLIMLIFAYVNIFFICYFKNQETPFLIQKLLYSLAFLCEMCGFTAILIPFLVICKIIINFSMSPDVKWQGIILTFCFSLFIFALISIVKHILKKISLKNICQSR